MDNLVDYIKKNYPKVIFTPFKFKQTRALAFIISDNKLVIGYINAAGSLCKLINPIDLENLTNEDTIYNITEGKWYIKDDKVLVFLPEISLEPILIADFSTSEVDIKNNINFLLCAKDNFVNLIEEVKRLRSLLNLNCVDYNI